MTQNASIISPKIVTKLMDLIRDADSGSWIKKAPDLGSRSVAAVLHCRFSALFSSVMSVIPSLSITRVLPTKIQRLSIMMCATATSLPSLSSDVRRFVKIFPGSATGISPTELAYDLDEFCESLTDGDTPVNS